MAMTSPAVKQAKFLRAFSRTALGLVMSKKSTDWGWNFEYVATGSDVDSTRIMWPSSNKRFLIILVIKYNHQKGTKNDKTSLLTSMADTPSLHQPQIQGHQSEWFDSWKHSSTWKASDTKCWVLSSYLKLKEAWWSFLLSPRLFVHSLATCWPSNIGTWKKMAWNCPGGTYWIQTWWKEWQPILTTRMMKHKVSWSWSWSDVDSIQVSKHSFCYFRITFCYIFCSILFHFLLLSYHFCYTFCSVLSNNVSSRFRNTHLQLWWFFRLLPWKSRWLNPPPLVDEMTKEVKSEDH